MNSLADFSIVSKHFPQLSKQQVMQFQALFELYKSWNDKINVISRKDIDRLYERHVLHSLSIAKIISFRKGAEILDIGTGGGFPGIPLAILFPETKFTLVDSIGKKIKVVKEVVNSIGLKNVDAQNKRAEELKDTYDFIVSRATAPLGDLAKWTKGKCKEHNLHELNNGIICLKGGNLEEELSDFKRQAKMWNIGDFFDYEFFESKKVVWLPLH